MANILNAEFKGVNFFVEKESLPKFGRFLKKHEYPNTSEQFVEDVGGFPTEFEIEGFVIGENSKDQLNALINACNEKGPGKLVLPYFGEFLMYAGECSVSAEPYKDNERIDFKAYFCASRAESGLIPDVATETQVLANSEIARIVIKDSIENNFTPNKFDALASKIAQSDFIQIIKDINKLIRFIPDMGQDTILNSLNLVSSAIGDLINDSAALADWLNGDNGLYTLLSTGLLGEGNYYLLSTILDLSNSYEDKQTTSISLLNLQSISFSDDLESFDLSGGPYWNDDTEIRKLRNEQRRILNEIHRYNLLLLAYETFCSAEFNDDKQAIQAKIDIENAYKKLVHPDNYDRITDFSVDCFELLNKTRLLSLAASQNSQVIKYKVQKENNPFYYGSSILCLSYISQAEQLNNENDLLSLTETMRNANQRKTYLISGEFTVLRRQ